MKIKKYLFWALGLILIGGILSCEQVKKAFKTSSPQPLKLVIVPLGDIPIAEVESVKQMLLSYYNLQIQILPHTTFPAYTTNEAVGKAIKTALPLRYRADSLLRFLKREKLGKADYVLGLTNVDITTTNRYKKGKEKEEGQIMFPVWMHADWGIFGLGYLGGKACVVSSYRLRIFDNPSQAVLHSRISKVARHEVGHNFGLDHCKNKNSCFMSEASWTNALMALDKESDSLCVVCKRRLGNLVKAKKSPTLPTNRAN